MSSKLVGITFASTILFATITSGLLLSSSSTHATDDSAVTVTEITVPSSCSMTANVSTPHIADIVNGNRAINIGKTTLSTFCNDPGGFAIYAVGYTNDAVGDTRLLAVDNIQTINTGNTVVGGSSNWGMKIVNDSTSAYPPTISSYFNTAANDGYVAVPNSLTLAASRNSGTSVSGASRIDTTYGAYISPTQPVGSYNGQVLYVMVHPSGGSPSIPEQLGSFAAAYNNAGKETVGGYYKMQDMSPTICSDVSIGETAWLLDIRDNTIYKVGKLNDGNCWFLENLHLGGETVLTLSSQNSNLINDFTLPISSSQATFNKDSASSFFNPLMNSEVRNSTSVVAGQTVMYGNYYNFCAASAGTYCSNYRTPSSNTNQDICPKGWRMPSGGSASAEYYQLYSSYPGGDEAFQQALRIPLNGCFLDGNAYPRGQYGCVWSSTLKNETSASVRNFAIYPQEIRVNDTSSRVYGMAIRCMANRGNTLKDIHYMQDITPEIIANTRIGDRASLVDNRDGEMYVVSKLADGKIWMLENLRLGGNTTMTLTNQNTNISGSFTLPASTPVSDFSNSTFTVPKINGEYKDTTVNVSSYTVTVKYGNYYNFCAASAGTYCAAQSATDAGELTEDICPSNWRIPFSATQSNSEYNTLYNAYSSNRDNFQNDFYATYNGCMLNNTSYPQGSHGCIWGNSYNGQSANNFYISETALTPRDGSRRGYGMGVRCVAK